MFSASPDLLSCLQLRANKQYKAKNGPLDCVQKNYHVAESTPDSKPAMVAEDYANRLRKNLKKFEKWARQKELNVTACMTPIYRNITLPLTVMPTGWWCRVCAAKTIDAHKARQRLFDIIAATISVLGIAPNKLVLKTRERQKGKISTRNWARRASFLKLPNITLTCW